MSEFLDRELSNEFRRSINKSNIFIYDKDLCKYYNLICVVMDRLDSSIKYINQNSEPPKTENELLVFLMYCCMVKDAISELLFNLKIENEFLNTNNDESYKFFKEIYLTMPLNVPKDKCPIDDKFFEYIRSLAFAHPFNTDRPTFFRRKEIQYSPWVIPNSKIMSLRGHNGGIGVRIYYSKQEEIIDLIFPFQNLKEFIKSRYMQLEKANLRVNQIILEKDKEWKSEKIPSNLSSIEILEYMLKKSNERYIDDYYLSRALSYINCNLTDNTNYTNVSIFKNALLEVAPKLFDQFKKLDYNGIAEILDDILNARTTEIQSIFGYQLEKIFTYLHYQTSTNNIEWGLKQAELFANEFAKKWVTISPRKMSFDEIKLLVATSCYLESKFQNMK